MANTCPKCNADNPDTKQFCGDCGTQLPSLEDVEVTETIEVPKDELTRGTTFAGRYEIIEELGKGGMGRVYRVEDTKAKEEIALKLIKPEIALDKKTIERFRNELTTARRITHKNVCRMYDLGEEKGLHFITMEYISGQDLKGLIRQTGQLTVGKAISVTKQICDGLTEAHSLGVVHRDLKPNNIMIDRGGNAKIMDFGIARAVKGKSITGSGVMIGTPQYMSPEQVEGKDVDHRSDIYSLGIILYEMLTDRVPFDGDTPLTVGVKQKTEAPKDPREFNERIQEELSRLILKCLAKEKENRFQSAAEVKSELEKIEQGLPTTDRVMPKKKTLTSREVTVTFGVKKLFIPALIIAAIIIAAIAIWQLLPKKDVIPLTPTDRPLIAIMYFDNNTGDEGLDNWRKALPDLLITDLSQSKYLSVLTGDRIYSILKQLNLLETRSFSTEDLEKVASKGNATHILYGNYVKFGDTLRINIMLKEATTLKLIASENVDGVGEEGISGMVDELTKLIKKSFELTPQEIAQDIDKEIGEITTSSLEAYKYYSEARKYHGLTEYQQAIPFYEKAVAVDPEFAMAYRGMATAYGNSGYGGKWKSYLQKAFELRDRLSDRERYWIEADYFIISEETYDKAIEACNRLLELYPNDPKGYDNLGYIYADLEEWDKAIEKYQVLCQGPEKEFVVYPSMLSYAYQGKGLYDKAKEVLDSYLNTFADHPQIHESLSTNYMIQGKYDFALEEADKAIALDPTSMGKGHIYLLQGDFVEAEKDYQRWLERDTVIWQLQGRRWLEILYRTQGQYKKATEQAQQGFELAERLGEMNWKARFFYRLAYNYRISGNPEKALEEYEKAWDNALDNQLWPDQIGILQEKGYTYLEMRSVEKALEEAEKLKEMLENSLFKKWIRFYNHLMGTIELERGNFSKAIDSFKRAYSLVPEQNNWINHHAFFIYPLGLSYVESGDLDEAREEYEKIISFTTGRLYWGDLYVKSFYMLGKIHEQQGDTTKAIEHYEKFLDLWKDADPGIAEVEDAKKRLAGLRD